MRIIYTPLLLLMIPAPALQAQPVSSKMEQKKGLNISGITAAANFPGDCDGSVALGAGGMQITKQTENRVVNGVGFSVPVQRAELNKQLCVTADLTDLMSKIPAIVATWNMPTNNCASYAGPNPVIEVYNSALAPVMVTIGAPTNFSFSMNGKMTPWTCKPGLPVVSTSWTKNKWGVPVPHTSISKGPDIKTVGIVQPFNESITYRLEAVGNVIRPVEIGKALPAFSLLVPAVDVSPLIANALKTAQPGIAPIKTVEGAQYDGTKLRIWGSF